jgi:hypothetical protein
VAPSGSRPSSAHRSAATAAATASSSSSRPSSSTSAAAASSTRMGHHGSTLHRPSNPLTLSTALGSATAAPLSSHGHVRQNSSGSSTRSDPLLADGGDDDAAALGGPGFVLRPPSTKRASHSLASATGAADGSRPGSRGV